MGRLSHYTETVPPERLKSRLVALYPRAMLVVACLWFAQLYCTMRPPYISLHLYAHGRERMPFQGRDLMRWPMLAASHSNFLQHLTAARALLHSPEFLVMELTSAVALFFAGWAAMKLYRLAAPGAPLPELPFALLIVICLFDFVLTVPYSFPTICPPRPFSAGEPTSPCSAAYGPFCPSFSLGPGTAKPRSSLSASCS